jgi:splicing factor 3B subunit 3
VTLSHGDDGVRGIHVTYFDSLPVASALCVLRTGYLFCAAEFSNQYAPFLF